MTSNHHALYVLGDTRATMTTTKRRKTARLSKSRKGSLSSDRSLQLDFVKLELLVIANQTCRGEYVLGACTHCPSNHESW
jgi:hypothetical protein